MSNKESIIGICNLCEQQIHESEDFLEKDGIMWHKICYEELIAEGLMDEMEDLE